MIKSLSLYTWPCSIADSGSIVVLAYDVRGARQLVREHPQASALMPYVLGRPTVERGPRVVDA